MRNKEKKTKSILLRIDNDNYELIKKLAKENATSMNEILISLIELFRTDKIPLPKINSINRNVRRNHRMTLNFSDDELEYLKALSKFHDFKTVNKLVQFLIVDSICTKHSFTPIEMSSIIEAAMQAKKMGINLNQLVKSINERNTNIEIKPDNFKAMLDLIFNKINDIYKASQEAYQFLETRWKV